MTNEVLPSLGPPHNEVGLRFLGRRQDFFQRRTKGERRVVIPKSAFSAARRVRSLRWVRFNTCAVQFVRGIELRGEFPMPLVRISLRQGTTPEYRKAVADGVHRAMLESLAVPVDDRFQVITEHDAGGLIYDPQFLGIERSDRVVFVQIALSAGRKPQQKRQLYKRMAEILAENPGLRPQDLVINLVEVAWENWSFGNGEAQYMDR